MITSDDDTSEPLDLLADSSDDPPQCARQPKKVFTAPRDYLPTDSRPENIRADVLPRGLSSYKVVHASRISLVRLPQ